MAAISHCKRVDGTQAITTLKKKSDSQLTVTEIK